MFNKPESFLCSFLFESFNFAIDKSSLKTSGVRQDGESGNFEGDSGSCSGDAEKFGSAREKVRKSV